MRDELLNETMFRTMAHARALIRAWADDCNEERPHSALGYQTPKAFAGCSTCAMWRIVPKGPASHDRMRERYPTVSRASASRAEPSDCSSA